MKRVVPTPAPASPQVTSAAALGAAIRARRTAGGLTLEDTAGLLGMAKQTLADIEHGKDTVSLAVVLKALDGLGLDLYVLAKQHQHAAQHLHETTR